MGRNNLIRHWRRVAVSILLWLVLPALGQDTSSTAAKPKKPVHNSTKSKTSTAKTKSAAAKSSTARHTPSHKPSGTSTHSASQKNATHGKKSSKSSKTAKKRGQQAIDGDRARAIQEALIREHYMDGEPSGTWDATTQAAMQRYQADQGWQAKTTPDSRALIKLGLGPSHDHLLNPESAMTSSPPADPKPAPKPDAPPNNLPQQ